MTGWWRGRRSGDKMTPEQLAANGSEDGHQAALFCWIQQNRGDARLPGIDKMFAIPNGGARSAATGARLKMTGVKRGVPDTFLPVPFGQYAGLFIEMKKPADREKHTSKGRTSNEQDEFLSFLTAMHYKCEVCFTWEEAVAALKRYYMVQE